MCATILSEFNLGAPMKIKATTLASILPILILAFASTQAAAASKELAIDADSCAIHLALTGQSAPSCPQAVDVGLTRSLGNTDASKNAAPLGSDAADNGYYIRFAFNSDVLTPEYRSHLDRLSQVLKTPQLAQACVRLVGHTDAIGSENFNLDLSHKRANSVRNYLVGTNGLVVTRIRAIGLGKTSPLAAVPSTHPIQRRVEIQARPPGNTPCS